MRAGSDASRAGTAGAFATDMRAVSRDDRATTQSCVLLIIAVSLFVRLVLAVAVGFSFDESYNVVVAREFHLAYFDHPPAIMWLVGAMTHLTGSESHLIVRLPTLLLFTLQNWLLYRLTETTFGARAGLFAVGAISLSPLFIAYFGVIVVTDGPLMCALTGAALYVARALFDPRNPSRDWLLAGVWLGLAMLSKFTAVLLLPGLVLFILTVPRHRRLFLTWPPYAAAAVALLVFSPVIIWNLQHEMSAFVFQGSRAALDLKIHVKRVLVHLAVFIGAIGVLVWPLQMVAIYLGLRAGPHDQRRWFFALLAAIPLAFFLVVDLFGSQAPDVRAHWGAPGYLMAFPLAGALAVDLFARFQALSRWIVRLALAAFALMLVGFVGHAYTGWIGAFAPAFEEYDPVVSDQTDWQELRAVLASRGLLDPQKAFVLAGRYEFCFKTALVLDKDFPVACLTENPIYKVLAHDDAALRGRDAVIITDWWNAPQALAEVTAKFESVEALPPAWMTLHGRPTRQLHLLVARELKAPLFGETR